MLLLRSVLLLLLFAVLPMQHHTLLCTPTNTHMYTEMDYNAATEDEPAGEVLLRGPQLFSGYYKQVWCDDQGWCDVM